MSRRDGLVVLRNMEMLSLQNGHGFSGGFHRCVRIFAGFGIGPENIVPNAAATAPYVDWQSSEYHSLEGDTAVNSISRRKPCATCGGTGHVSHKKPRRPKCATCNQRGHASSDCPQYYRYCDACPESGHTAQDCPKRSKSSNRNEYGYTASQSTQLHSTRTCDTCGQKGHEWQDCVCPNCNLVGHAASNCPQPSTTMFCYACREYGHEPQDCPQGPICANCNRSNHTIRECPLLRPQNPCRKCGYDHFSESCPQAQAKRKKIKCRSCSTVGHASKNCPELPCSNCGRGDHVAFCCPLKY